jgi:hypothetical protein
MSGRVAPVVTDLAGMLQARAATMALMQLPASGRGIIAAQDIPQGTIVHQESPMLCTPPAAPGNATMCAACLRPVNCRQCGSHIAFCSSECEDVARQDWFDIEESCDFAALREYCAAHGEKFPLLAARLACQVLQRKTRAHGGTTQPSKTGDAPCATQENCVTTFRGDACRDLRQLCFVNLNVIPPQWKSTHALLHRGLAPALNALRQQQSNPNVTLSFDPFDVDWYVDVLSRLHINAFRVDNVVLPLGSMDDPRALLKAASGLAGGDGNQQGSAVFLLASMFNHSCYPTLTVTWPGNDATAAFVAATDIPKHTELTITYIDNEQSGSARREALWHAYGFHCQCPKCRLGHL